MGEFGEQYSPPGAEDYRAIGGETPHVEPAPEQQAGPEEAEKSVTQEITELSEESQKLTAEYKAAFGVDGDEQVDTLRSYVRLLTGDPQGRFTQEATGLDGQVTRTQTDLLRDAGQAKFREKIATFLADPASQPLRRALGAFETALANGSFGQTADNWQQSVQGALLNPNQLTEKFVVTLEQRSREAVVARRTTLANELGRALPPNRAAEYRTVTQLMAEGKIEVVGDPRHQLSALEDMRHAGLIEAIPGLSWEQAQQLVLSLANAESEQPSQDRGPYKDLAQSVVQLRDAHAKGLVEDARYTTLLRQTLADFKASRAQPEAAARPVQPQPAAEQSSAQPEAANQPRVQAIDRLLDSQIENAAAQGPKNVEQVAAELEESQHHYQMLSEHLGGRLRAEDLQAIHEFYTGQATFQGNLNPETYQWFENNPQAVTVFRAIDQGVQEGVLQPGVRAAVHQQLSQGELKLDDLNLMAQRLAERFADKKADLIDEKKPRNTAGVSPSYNFALHDGRRVSEGLPKQYTQRIAELRNAAAVGPHDAQAAYRALDDLLRRDRSSLDLIADLGETGVLFSAQELAHAQAYGDPTHKQNMVRNIQYGIDSVRDGQGHLEPDAARREFYQQALDLRTAFHRGLIPSRDRYRALLLEAARGSSLAS